MTISVVVPCYGSEHTIEQVCRETLEVIRNYDDYEMILVNDGSYDKVWDKIRQLAGEDPHLVGVDLAKNFGQHSALMAGYACACGDVIVSIDDDGQTPVDRIPDLIKGVERHDVVYGVYPEIKQTLFRRFGSNVNRKMSEWMIGKPKETSATSFFALKRFVVEEIVKYQNAYPYIEGLILRCTRNIGNVEVQQRERISGKSNYSVKKLLKLWINGFTAFSIKPLRLATGLGVLCSVAGFAYAMYVIILKCLGSVQMGYSSLMAAILIIGGIIMCLLGIIGEYIGRIYICMNASPQYVVREIWKKPDC